MKCYTSNWFLCHSSVLINVLLSICHILIVASLDPLAKSKPFYLKARQVIEPICDLNIFDCTVR